MERADRVPDVTEAPRLGAVPVDLQRLVPEGRPHEPGHDHAVLGALPRADGVEEARDDDVEARLAVVREREELVHRLRVGVRPPALRRRPVDPPVVLGERPLLPMVAVDLGGRGDEHPLAEGVGVLQDELRPAEVRHERAHRLLDDQPHADGGGEVVDDVAAVDELVDGGRVQHRVDDEVEARPVAQVRDVLERAGREVVQHPHLDALVEQELGEVRADEPGSAGHERLGRHERGAYRPLRRRCCDGGGVRYDQSVASTRSPRHRRLRMTGKEGSRQPCSSALQSGPGRSSSSPRTKHVR